MPQVMSLVIVLNLLTIVVYGIEKSHLSAVLFHLYGIEKHIIVDITLPCDFH